MGDKSGTESTSADILDFAATLAKKMEANTRIAVKFPDGHQVCVDKISNGSPTVPPRHGGLTCRNDILLHLLDIHGTRKTAMEIRSDLKAVGPDHDWGERTITQTLAKLVKEGLVDNDQKSCQRGYSLTAAGIREAENLPA